MSRKKAINQHCKECIYDPLVPGTWRQQVEACHLSNCPLYEYRPVSYKKRSTLDPVVTPKQAYYKNNSNEEGVGIGSDVCIENCMKNGAQNEE